MRVILVEDDPDAAVLTARYLERAGFPPETYGTAEAALNSIGRERDLLLVADWGLPGMDGLALLGEVRRLEDGPDIYFLMLTARNNPEEIRRAIQAGADDYLTKPIVGDTLQVRTLLAEQRLATRRTVRRQRQDLERVRRSEERYELAARVTDDGIWDWNLTTNRIFLSDRWREIAGLDQNSERTAGPRSDDYQFWLGQVHPDDRERVDTDIQNYLASPSERFVSEHRLARSNEQVIWVRVRGMGLRSEDGQVHRLTGTMTDVSEEKRLEENLYRNALFDSETGLPNRALFQDRLSTSRDRAARRPDYLSAVLSIEIDRFSLVSDNMAPKFQGELVKAVADRLLTHVRTSDTLARLTEDRFAFLLDDLSDQSQAEEFFNKIQNDMSRPFPVDGQDIFLGTNIGIAFSSSAGDGDAILREAEIAGLHAREKGSAGYEVYREFMQTHLRIRMQLEKQLREALLEMDFELYYQPIVSLSARKIVGVEALLRWHHKELGFISPAQFIPIAEETGMIDAIGEWTLQTATKQAMTWRNAGLPDIYVTVNLSARQFLSQDIVEVIKNATHESGLPPDQLVLELTETVAMEDMRTARDILAALREAGFRSAIDDFGTGYSGLSYLKSFPVDILKIDGSFIADVTAGTESAAIVMAIIGLANGFNMRLVAEGVEDRDQLEFLQAYGCDLLQGYYLSRPLPADELAQLLSQNGALAERIG